jgi:signal transduction histidine kinase
VSLRARVVLLVSAAVLTALVVFGWIAQTIVVNGFADLEQADAAERLQRVTSAVQADLDGQLALTRSYARQPDAALLLRGIRQELYAWRGTPDALRAADLDALLFLDGLGRSVLQVTDGRPLPGALEQRLRDNSLRVSGTGEPHVQGLVASQDGIAAFVTHQVTGTGSAVPLGTVVSVRRIDDDYLQRLADRSFVTATLFPVRDRGLRMAPAPLRPEGVHVDRAGEVVQATGFLPDPAGWYAVGVSADVPRAIAGAGREATFRLFLLILVTTIAVGAVVVVWFERRLVSRLARLAGLVARSDGADRPRVELDGDDELTDLADRIQRTLTSLEVAQAALRRTNAELAIANRMKDDFVAMVSHEFRTPLTAIRGYADTLRRYRDRIDDDKRDRFTERITVQTRALERMVDDLLTLAQSREGTVRALPEDVRLVDVVAEALELVEEGGALTVDVDPDLVVFADPDHVRRIIVNYAENAGKYGATPIVVTAAATDTGVELRVRDHGDGVEPDFVPSLFERFSQASVGTQRTATGVGLGLSIVRTLAEANGGDVWHEPTSPGAVFVVRLPSGRRRKRADDDDTLRWAPVRA